MSENEFEEFSNNLLEDRDFIIDRKEEMYIDSIGQMHGLLALNLESGDGILIDSQGHKYARYTAFMPNIKPYIEQQISMVAEQIIKEAVENTSNGSWAIYFDEIEESYGIVLKENNGIGTLLLDELTSRDEIAEIEVLDDCFDMTIYLDYCSNLDEEIKPSQNMNI
ncbi:DUF6329 domain-containing protein [Clostridium algidicarnis]|uniref:DUF6329 domain-containing protein n=1 Tax=Clostridium algidicarnis TaxID=37659 RepID=UPI001CF42855|nr:DUF6329 domain-containing protein [Clostridium algidicarnis]MCB2288118.1 DUF6329 domain-containing protein [Clostridium algidicarnis]